MRTGNVQRIALVEWILSRPTEKVLTRPSRLLLSFALLRPAFFIHLGAPRNGQRFRRNVVSNGGTRGGVRSFADTYGRHQHVSAANENVFLNRGGILFFSIV